MKTLVLTSAVLIFLSLNSLAQWSTDPAVNNALALTSGEEAIPKVMSGPDGITYVAWFSNESGNYDVRLQKLDVYGNKLWADEGLLISDNPAMTWLTDWDMYVGNDGFAYLTFQDIRNVDNDVFAYRVSPEGEMVWGADGIEMSTGPAFDVSPKVVVTDAGNAVFAWQADEVIIVQKISPDGTKLWGNDGITFSTANTLSWPQLLPVGNDEVMLKFFEDSGPSWAPTRHVYANRLDADGNKLWSEDAIISDAGGISAWTQIFPMISDGSDGFYIAWHDDRDANNLSSTFVQHIGSDGQVLLGANGTEASIQEGRHNFYPQLATVDGSDDIFVFWNEMDPDQNNRGIYGQKISAAGERLWSDFGKKFIEISPVNVYPLAARPANSNIVLFYEEFFDGINSGIKAMQLDADGNFVWADEMLDLCTVQSEKVHAEVSNFNSSQWVAVWEDSRNGNKDIYGQNIQVDGTLGPVVISGEIEISPDTLFFEENPQTLSCKIINNTSDTYTITNLTEWGDYWWIADPVPVLPLDLAAGDSLVFDVHFELITNIPAKGYEFDDLQIISELDTNTVVVAINEDLITEISLSELNVGIPIYPNPFTQAVTFGLQAMDQKHIEINIFNSLGEKVRKLSAINETKISWDGKDENGRRVEAGTYFYTLSDGSIQKEGKLIRK